MSRLGRFDIIACVIAKNRERLAFTITEELLDEDFCNLNLNATETHVALYNKKLLIPAESVINALLQQNDKKTVN